METLAFLLRPECCVQCKCVHWVCVVLPVSVCDVFV